MITNKKYFSSNFSLVAMLMVCTTEYMLDTCRKLGLHVSPNLKKEGTARHIAREILDNPLAVLNSLSKGKLQLVAEFVKAGLNQYLTNKYPIILAIEA